MQTYVMHIKNGDIDETRRIVKEMRKVAKKYSVKLVARGRCMNRRLALASVGRPATPYAVGHSDFYLNHPAAHLCHSFAIYRTLSKTHSEDAMGQLYWDFYHIVPRGLAIHRSSARLKV